MIDTGRKKILLLLIIAVTLVVIIFGIVLSLFFNTSQTNKTEVPSITPTSFPTVNTQKSSTDLFSPLEKTVIGKTTEKEIEQSQKILNKTQKGDITIYMIQSPTLRGNDIIHTKDGIVIFEDTSTTTNAVTIPLISAVEKDYGKPEEKIDKVGEGFYISAYLYPTKGFAVYGNRYTDSVFEIQRFKPMTLAEYKTEYGEYLSPAAEMPREGADIHE